VRLDTFSTSKESCTLMTRNFGMTLPEANPPNILRNGHNRSRSLGGKPHLNRDRTLDLEGIIQYAVLTSYCRWDYPPDVPRSSSTTERYQNKLPEFGIETPPTRKVRSKVGLCVRLRQTQKKYPHRERKSWYNTFRLHQGSCFAGWYQ